MDGFSLPERLKHNRFYDIETRFRYKIMDVKPHKVYFTGKSFLMVGISNERNCKKARQYLRKK